MPSRIQDAAHVERWRSDLADGTVRWRVVLQADQIVAFAGTGPSGEPLDPALGEPDTIAVDPLHWRAGIGRLLMADALLAMTRAGFRSAILWTLADYEQGQRFYLSTGWHREGSSRDNGLQVAFGHPLKHSPSSPSD